MSIMRMNTVFIILHVAFMVSYSFFRMAFNNSCVYCESVMDETLTKYLELAYEFEHH